MSSGDDEDRVEDRPAAVVPVFPPDQTLFLDGDHEGELPRPGHAPVDDVRLDYHVRSVVPGRHDLARRLFRGRRALLGSLLAPPDGLETFCLRSSLY